jgi:hypothetical protein
MIVKLRKQHPEYRDLTPGQPYVVIGIEANDFRLLNDHGRPFLYPANLFRMEDSVEPPDWVSEVGDEGEKYAYPAPLNRPGFFEDFFDGDEKTIGTFWRTVNKRLASPV